MKMQKTGGEHETCVRYFNRVGLFDVSLHGGGCT